MSNMLPGDNSGAEPKGHRDDCPTLCVYAGHKYGIEDGECLQGHTQHDECDCDERDIADMEAAIEARAEAYYERGWID